MMTPERVPLRIYANHSRQSIDLELAEAVKIPLSVQETEGLIWLLERAIKSLNNHESRVSIR
jgi:hypothetical protein